MSKYREDENHNLVLVDGTVIPESKRTRCEVYSRVVGYLRPVNMYNAGKKEEFKLRKNFSIKEKSNLKINKGGTNNETDKHD